MPSGPMGPVKGLSPRYFQELDTNKVPISSIIFHKKKPPQGFIKTTLVQAFKAKCMQNQIFSSSISFLDMELSLFEKYFNTQYMTNSTLVSPVKMEYG